MRINNVELKNIRIFENLFVEFDKTNILCGPNGQGKSTIVEMIEFSLTGRCSWTDGRGLGKDTLTRTGTNSGWVKLNFDDNVMFERPTISRPGIMSEQKNLYSLTGLTQEIIRACLRPGYFVNDSKDNQKELLFEVLGVSVTDEEIVESLKSINPEVDLQKFYLDNLHKMCLSSDKYEWVINQLRETKKKIGEVRNEIKRIECIKKDIIDYDEEKTERLKQEIRKIDYERAIHSVEVETVINNLKEELHNAKMILHEVRASGIEIGDEYKSPPVLDIEWTDQSDLEKKRAEVNLSLQHQLCIGVTHLSQVKQIESLDVLKNDKSALEHDEVCLNALKQALGPSGIKMQKAYPVVEKFLQEVNDLCSSICPKIKLNKDNWEFCTESGFPVSQLSYSQKCRVSLAWQIALAKRGFNVVVIDESGLDGFNALLISEFLSHLNIQSFFCCLPEGYDADRDDFVKMKGDNIYWVEDGKVEKTSVLQRA